MRQAVQSVGNLGLQLGHGKELWMEPLHPIILYSVASVKDFLDKLIDIDSGKKHQQDTVYSVMHRVRSLLSLRHLTKGTSGP